MGELKFGKKLEYQLEAHHMTQSELAKRCGYSVGTISNLIRRSKRDPSVDLVCRCAEALGINVGELLNRDGANSVIQYQYFKTKEELGENMQRLFDEKQLTIKAVDKVCEITNEQLRRYIRGVNLPLLSNALLIADTIGVSIDELLATNSLATDTTDKESAVDTILAQIELCKDALTESDKKIIAIAALEA